MPKYVSIVAYLHPDELEEQYRQAVDPVERSHFQVIWLLSCGKRVHQVTEETGYGANWIRIVARRYNQQGPAVLADQRQHNRGGAALLTGSQQECLSHLLLTPPADGSLWTGPKVACWMSQQLGRRVHPQRGWEYLKRLGFSPQLPRHRHP